MATTQASTDIGHPLAPLTADEVSAAAAIVRGDGRLSERARFAYVGLAEPDKATVRSFTPGDPVDRRVRMQMVDGPEANVVEVVVSVTTGQVTEFTQVPDSRPGLLFEESFAAISQGVRAVHIVGRLSRGHLMREVEEPGSVGTVLVP